MRRCGERSFLFANLKIGKGVAEIADLIVEQGGMELASQCVGLRLPCLMRMISTTSPLMRYLMT